MTAQETRSRDAPTTHESAALAYLRAAACQTTSGHRKNFTASVIPMISVRANRRRPSSPGRPHSAAATSVNANNSANGISSIQKQKKLMILKTLNQLNQIEKFVFTKLITGGFRIGVDISEP